MVKQEQKANPKAKENPVQTNKLRGQSNSGVIKITESKQNKNY